MLVYLSTAIKIKFRIFLSWLREEIQITWQVWSNLYKLNAIIKKKGAMQHGYPTKENQSTKPGVHFPAA